MVDTAKGRATLNIDPDLHRELKIEAARQGMKLSEFAERLLRDGLRRRQHLKEE